MSYLKNSPAFYFPPVKGKYTVTAGLFALTHDFGNPLQDQKIFQFDNQFTKYRKAKLSSRAENLAKYYCQHLLADESRVSACQFLINQLSLEYPAYFQQETNKEGLRLTCLLTNELLTFDAHYNLLDDSRTHAQPAYQDSIDALASQICEDIVIVEFDHQLHWNALLHLCLPNHWSATDMAGQSFIKTHQAVPGMENIFENSHTLLSSIRRKGPYSRFAWGLSTDTRLNHHPQAPQNENPQLWKGRRFDKNAPELYLRVERQTLFGLSNSKAIMFTIRTYHYDIQEDLNRKQRQQIASAISDMGPQALEYKGLVEQKADILDWLSTLI